MSIYYRFYISSFHSIATQTNVLTWKTSANTVNFPGSKTTYVANLEIFEPISTPTTFTRKITLRSKIPTIDLSPYLNETTPYTNFRVSLRAKTKWSMSRNIETKNFYTMGKSASPPRNFRVFWSPVEKVTTLKHHILNKLLTLW